MLPLYVYGAGGLGREILYYVLEIVQQSGEFCVEGFVDDGVEVGKIMQGYPVLGGFDFLVQRREKTAVVMGIAETKIKRRLMERLSENSLLSFPTMIHPTAYLAKNVHIAEGVVVTPFVFISLEAVLERGVFLNVGTQVGHDCWVKAYSSVMPSVNLSGGVIVEEECFIGVGAKVLQGIHIGTGSVVGANSLVLRNVPPGVTAFGNPAIPRKFT